MGLIGALLGFPDENEREITQEERDQDERDARDRQDKKNADFGLDIDRD